MRTSKFSEEQIIGFLKQVEAGVPVKDVCRKGGFSDATFYKWRAKYGAMDVPDAGRLHTLFALSNLWMARAKLLVLDGQVRPKAANAARRIRQCNSCDIKSVRWVASNA